MLIRLLKFGGNSTLIKVRNTSLSLVSLIAFGLHSDVLFLPGLGGNTGHTPVFLRVPWWQATADFS